MLDGLVRRAERQHGEHGAEDLLARDPVRRATPVKKVGGNQKPRSGSAHGGWWSSAPSATPVATSSWIRFELRGGVDRPDVGVLVERVADAQRRDAALELRDDRLGDRLLHEQPRAGAADVALVEVDAVDDALDGLVEGASSNMMFAALPPSSSVSCLPRAGERARDRLADLGRARERDLREPGCVTSSAPVARRR